MRKRMLIVVVAVLLVIATVFAGCEASNKNNDNDALNTNQIADGNAASSQDNGDTETTSDKTVQSIVLSKSTISIGIGETESLAAFATPDDIEVTYDWSSTNVQVATVSAEGVVTGVAKGTAVIKVKAGSVFALCNVEVVEKSGSVTGTVTYKYNDYVGNKPDTDATVVLISKNVETLPDSLALGLTYDLPAGCFSTKVDGTGKYLIDNVPVGNYVIILISKNTNSGDSHNGWLAWGGFTYYKFSEDGQKTADNTYFLHKITNKSITIEANKTVTFSHDFGITYY